MHPSPQNLRRHEQFHSAFLPDDRDVLVWLPPGYHEGSHEGSHGGSHGGSHEGSHEGSRVRRYPVLYMHDGQNLFDPETAYQKGHHWRVGETATELISAGSVEPLIIVGIYNTGTSRIQEYTPTRVRKLGGGLANDYGRLIVDELKPLIDATYRTRPEAAHTGLAGSSLGALATLHLAYRYPTTFGRLGVLSPSVWWDRRTLLRTVRGTRPAPPFKLWVDMGTAEGRRGLADARSLKKALIHAGFVEGLDLRYREYDGATHSEDAWASRVGPMLEWLYPQPAEAADAGVS